MTHELTLYPGDFLCDSKGRHVVGDDGIAVTVQSETSVEMDDEDALQHALEHIQLQRARIQASTFSSDPELSREERLTVLASQVEGLQQQLLELSSHD